MAHPNPCLLGDAVRGMIVVVRMAASPGELWAQLAAGLDVEFRGVAPGDFRGVPNAAAVVVAASGAEREAVGWLEGRDIPAHLPLYVAGAESGRRIAVNAIRHGATDYFALPEDAELLHNALAAAVSRHEEDLRRAAARDAGAVASRAFEAIVGTHPTIERARDIGQRVAAHPHATALIVGEAGSGKELFARAIHEASTRRGAPFVPVECAALPPGVVETAIFGRDPDLMQGIEAAPGLIEVAEGGTLFLDDVGALPAEAQVRLLTVLEAREVRRVGATRSRPANLRVIAASTDDLSREVGGGSFRRDLHLELSSVMIELPPLRDRRPDIVPIAIRLLQGLALLHDVPLPDMPAETRRAIEEHSWPGNARELKHALERALLLSPHGQLNVSELFPARAPRFSPPNGLPFPAPLDDITAAAATAMLEVCGGNVSEAARRLNISRTRLRRLARSASVSVLGSP